MESNRVLHPTNGKGTIKKEVGDCYEMEWDEKSPLKENLVLKKSVTPVVEECNGNCGDSCNCSPEDGCNKCGGEKACGCDEDGCCPVCDTDLLGEIEELLGNWTVNPAKFIKDNQKAITIFRNLDKKHKENEINNYFMKKGYKEDNEIKDIQKFGKIKDDEDGKYGKLTEVDVFKNKNF
jgi:hypothetical protein